MKARLRSVNEARPDSSFAPRIFIEMELLEGNPDEIKEFLGKQVAIDIGDELPAGLREAQILNAHQCLINGHLMQHTNPCAKCTELVCDDTMMGTPKVF